MTDKLGFESYITRILDQDAKTLKTLGSDFDEENISFWEKWGQPIHELLISKVESTNDN